MCSSGGSPQPLNHLLEHLYVLAMKPLRSETRNSFGFLCSKIKRSYRVCSLHTLIDHDPGDGQSEEPLPLLRRHLSRVLDQVELLLRFWSRWWKGYLHSLQLQNPLRNNPNLFFGERKGNKRFGQLAYRWRYLLVGIFSSPPFHKGHSGLLEAAKFLNLYARIILFFFCRKRVIMCFK